jgi:hypothetical protein
VLFCGRDIAPHGDLLDQQTRLWNQFDDGVCVRGVGHMPGDPKQCREHARRCWALASQIKNPALKDSLIEAAKRWAVLAAELETIHSLLHALEEPEKKAS